MRPIENIIQEVKEEIARLSQVVRLLEGTPTTPTRGQKAAQKSTARPTRIISAAGRKRIAAAQRARWAKIRAAKRG